MVVGPEIQAGCEGCFLRAFTGHLWRECEEMGDESITCELRNLANRLSVSEVGTDPPLQGRRHIEGTPARLTCALSHSCSFEASREWQRPGSAEKHPCWPHRKSPCEASRMASMRPGSGRRRRWPGPCLPLPPLSAPLSAPLAPLSAPLSSPREASGLDGRLHGATGASGR